MKSASTSKSIASSFPLWELFPNWSDISLALYLKSIRFHTHQRYSSTIWRAYNIARKTLQNAILESANKHGEAIAFYLWQNRRNISLATRHQSRMQGSPKSNWLTDLLPRFFIRQGRYALAPSWAVMFVGDDGWNEGGPTPRKLLRLQRSGDLFKSLRLQRKWLRDGLNTLGFLTDEIFNACFVSSSSKNVLLGAETLSPKSRLLSFFRRFSSFEKRRFLLPSLWSLRSLFVFRYLDAFLRRSDFALEFKVAKRFLPSSNKSELIKSALRFRFWFSSLSSRATVWGEFLKSNGQSATEREKGESNGGDTWWKAYFNTL